MLSSDVWVGGLNRQHFRVYVVDAVHHLSRSHGGCLLLLALQNGGEGDDNFDSLSVNQLDGSIVLAGQTDGGLITDIDFSIVKLDAEGLLLWEFQVTYAWN